MIYEIEIDSNSLTGKQVLDFLKKLNVSVNPVKSLLPEQIKLLEKSLKEIEEGKTMSHAEAMKQMDKWMKEK